MVKTCTLGVASLLAALLGGPMSAQPPTVVVNDYLKEVRVFDSSSAEFSAAASKLGVSASLATLGAGASLVVAIRNDSGEAIDSMRLLFQVDKEGQAVPHQIILWGSLAAGQATLASPRELEGALAALMNASAPRGAGGLGTGRSSARPSLDLYQRATVTASVDSATLASGRFLGADTQSFFSRLTAEQAAKKSFFADLTAQSKTLDAAGIKLALASRQSTAAAARQKSTGLADMNLAAMTESRLCDQALMILERLGGLPALNSWAERENMTLSSQPTLHR